MNRSVALGDRIATLDWPGIEAALETSGWANIGSVLSASECAELRAGYDNEALFRSRVVMARHGFGQGEYRYYDYPLPKLVAELRSSLYLRLATIANRWEKSLGRAAGYPDDLETFLTGCHRAGQKRATPLLLRYGEGDYNCLHQDLYGEIWFPLQVAFLLSRAQSDFTGGEFVLTEQRPRRQSRVDVVPWEQGEGLIFAVNQRPVAGLRGPYRVTMRHGVSRLRSGQRFTLGIIFHDAR
jgi:hypothetical protein